MTMRAAGMETLAGVMALAAGVAGICGVAGAQVTQYGPTPYLCFDDSPFAGLSFGYFYLETFEDHLLNVPGVQANQGGVTSVIFGPPIHDSVDCDDGTIDGSGLMGDSFFAPGDVRFTFDAGVLGSLPTHAGLVWTDGGPGTVVTFEAFDAAGALLGTIVGNHADASNNGETGEDRFYGMSFAGGISAIRIHHTSGGLEVDHLQYGGGVRCAADFDGDGTADFFDYDAFVVCFEGGACPPGKTADFDHDGAVDFFDYDAFVVVFERGC